MTAARRFLALFCLWSFLIVAPGVARGAALVWDGSANGLWTNAANWTPAFRPTNGDALFFPEGVAQTLVTNSPAGATNYHSITIAGSNYVLRSPFLAMTNGFTNSGPVGAENTVAARVVVRASQTWEVAAKTTLVLASNVSLTNVILQVAGDGVSQFNGTITGGAGSRIYKQHGGTMEINGTSALTELSVMDGTLEVNGTLTGTLTNAGILRGTGSVPAFTSYDLVQPSGFGAQALTVPSGTALFLSGTFRPTLNGPGTNYTQLRVASPPTLTGATLNLLLGYSPLLGDSFVIITNTGATAFSTTFAGRPEGATQTVNNVQFRVSYVGGNGNDVTLTVVGFNASATTRFWDGGGANGFWLNATNWSNNVMPGGGQNLLFPPDAARLSSTNDFPAGTTFNTLTFLTNGFDLSGNAVTLLGGLRAAQSSDGVSLRFPINYSGPQTVQVDGTDGDNAHVFLFGEQTLAGLLTLDGPGLVALAGRVRGFGGIDVHGGASLFGSLTNDYAGVTRVFDGAYLSVSDPSSLGLATAGNETVVDLEGVLTVDSVHTNAEPLQLGGYWSFHQSATWSGPVALSGTGIGIGTFTGGTGRVVGAISGAGVGVNKYDGGWLVLEGSNSVSGTLTNNDGNLTVNGPSRRLNVSLNFGLLGGTGEVANLTALGNGLVRPGLNRSGVLTCSNFTMSASTATFYVDVTPTGNNVLRTRGNVQLDGNITVATIFNPSLGVPFTIIDNQSASPVLGTFLGLPEGSNLTFGGLTYRVSYAGGDGNDVTLELISVNPTGVTRVWDAGGNDNNWSNPTNWSGNTLPEPGDTVVFPANLGPSDFLITNDLLPGLVLDRVVIRDGSGGSGTQVRGNSIGLLNGLLATNTTSVVSFLLPVVLAGPQTFSASGSPLALWDIALNGDLTFGGDSNVSVTVAGVISGTGGIVKTCEGVLRLEADNTFSGPVRILNGSLQIGANQALGLSGGGLFMGEFTSLSFSQPGALAESFLSITGAVSGTLTNSVPGEVSLVNALTPFNVPAGRQLTLAGPLTGPGSPLFQGGGHFVIAGTNVCASETTVQNATLRVTGLSAGGGVNVTVGGTLGGTGTVGQLSVQNSGVLSPGASPGALTSGQLGMFSGTTLLFEFNSATPGSGYDQVIVNGTVSLNNAALQLAPGFAPTIGTVFTVIVNDGGDAVTGTFTGLPEGTVVSTNGINLQISYTGGDGNDVTLTRVLTPTGFTRVWDGGGANNSWTNRFNWAGDALPVEGDRLHFPAGALRLNNTNDFPPLMGFDSISVGGAYTLGGAAVLLQNGVVVTNSTPVNFNLDLQLYGPQTFSVGSGLQLNLNRALALGAHTLTFSGNGSPTVGGPVTGGGGVIKAGSGTLTFNGTNAYDGLTDIVEGTFAIGHGTGLGTANAGTIVRAGTTLRWNNAITCFEPLILEGQIGNPAVLRVQSGSNALNAFVTLAGISPFNTFEVTGAELRVNDPISGSGLTKTGPGTLVLAGANTHTGDTRLEDGTLLVNGAQTSSAVLMSGAAGNVFGGTGRVASVSGTLGTVSPGQSPGRLTVAGTFFGSATRTNFHELNGPVAGSGYDQLVVQGNVQLNSTPLRLSFGYTPAFGDAFTLIDNQGLNPVVGTFAGLPEGSLLTNGAVVARLTYLGGTGNDVVLTRIAVPTGVTRVWDGGGAGNNWSTPANWVGDVAPQQGDSIVFPITTPKSPVFDAGTNAAFNSITFGSNYTLNVAAGHSLRLIAGITATNINGLARLFVPVILENNQTWTVQHPNGTLQAHAVDLSLATLNHAGAGHMELLGPVTGSGGFSGNASGNLLVGGTNTFTGTVTINSGTLTVLSSGALGSIGASTFIGTAGRLAMDLPGGGALDEPMIVAGRVEMVTGVTNLWTGSVTLAGTQVAFDSLNISRLEIHGPLSGTTFQTLNLGTVVLAGPSSIAGPVRVGGNSRLLVNTAHSSVTFVLTNSGRLGGSGPVAAIQAVNCTGCEVQPGPVNTPGRIQSATARLDGLAGLRVELNGPVPITDHDQWRINGTLALTNASLVVTASFDPPEGMSFLIVDNDDGEPAQGVFNNLPEGGLLTNGAVVLQISYVGGDGNDVTLTRVTAAPPLQLAAPSLSNGVPVVAGVGLPNLPYVLEATPHLHTPIPWQPILTNSADGAGLYQFMDFNGTNFPMRFYRVLSP